MFCARRAPIFTSVAEIGKPHYWKFIYKILETWQNQEPVYY